MSGYIRRSRFLLHKKKSKKKNANKKHCRYLFTSKNVRNQFILANVMQKRNTANTRHTESLFYDYFTRRGLTHTHTPQIIKERK